MTELLIIKAGAEYFRFQEDGFTPCAMNQASVFPMKKLAEAKGLCKKIGDAGIAEAILYKLTIVEEPYIE